MIIIYPGQRDDICRHFCNYCSNQFNKKDKDHTAALEWFTQNRPKLVLTDYILDELLTLALFRVDKKFALLVSRKVRDLFSPDINKITEQDFNEAWEVFDSYQDKDWSFTDCTSYVFIKRSGILKSFAFDPHFDQFGVVVRQPIS